MQRLKIYVHKIFCILDWINSLSTFDILKLLCEHIIWRAKYLHSLNINLIHKRKTNTIAAVSNQDVCCFLRHVSLREWACSICHSYSAVWFWDQWNGCEIGLADREECSYWPARDVPRPGWTWPAGHLTSNSAFSFLVLDLSIWKQIQSCAFTVMFIEEENSVQETK
jgi:hypothetical protein